MSFECWKSSELLLGGCHDMIDAVDTLVRSLLRSFMHEWPALAAQDMYTSLSIGPRRAATREIASELLKLRS